jgi:hypothetical protein
LTFWKNVRVNTLYIFCNRKLYLKQYALYIKVLVCQNVMTHFLGLHICRSVANSIVYSLFLLKSSCCTKTCYLQTESYLSREELQWVIEL